MLGHHDFCFAFYHFQFAFDQLHIKQIIKYPIQKDKHDEYERVEKVQKLEVTVNYLQQIDEEDE